MHKKTTRKIGGKQIKKQGNRKKQGLEGQGSQELAILKPSVLIPVWVPKNHPNSTKIGGAPNLRILTVPRTCDFEAHRF